MDKQINCKSKWRFEIDDVKNFKKMSEEDLETEKEYYIGILKKNFSPERMKNVYKLLEIEKRLSINKK